MKRDYIDFSHIETDHDAIHARLVNWARYVRDHPNMWPMQPMFRHAKTPRQWDINPHIRVEVDALDGLLVEKTIRRIPRVQCDALRWYYVYAGIPVDKFRQYMGMTVQGLDKAIRDGRAMLKNSLQRG